MGEIVAIRKDIKHENGPDVLHANKARLNFIHDVVMSDPDLLACIELELTGNAKAPEDTAERIGVFGVEQVLRDVRSYHGLSSFELGTAYRLCEESIAQRIQDERKVK